MDETFTDFYHHFCTCVPGITEFSRSEKWGLSNCSVRYGGHQLLQHLIMAARSGDRYTVTDFSFIKVTDI